MIYNRKIRVCVLVDSLGPYHVARMNALSERCSLTVIENYSSSQEYSWTYKPIKYFNVITLENFKEKRSIAKKLRDLLLELSPDVLLTPGWSGLLTISGTLLANEFNIPVIVMSDSQEIDFERTWFFEYLKRKYLMFVDGAFVAGHPHERYIKKLIAKSVPVSLGYDVVDNDYFEFASVLVRKSNSFYRTKYSLPDNYFLVISRLIEKKNVFRLIDAFFEFKSRSFISQKECDWRLVILGDGVLREKVVQYIESSPFSKMVILKGFVQYDELPIFYALAQALVLPSTTDQWGLVVNEAMASGLPVLVSNRCGCSEDLVADGKNGFVFDPFSVEAIADVLQKCADSPSMLTTMSLKSLEKIEAFSLRRYSFDLVQLIETVVSTKRENRQFLDFLFLKLLYFIFIFQSMRVSLIGLIWTK